MIAVVQVALERTDFWGIVVPGYLGAIGGLISAVVGALAFIQSLRNRGGVKSIAAALNRTSVNPPAQDGPAGSANASRASVPVSWNLAALGNGRYRLMNDSATTARLSAITVLAGSRSFATDAPLPTSVRPGDDLTFRLRQTPIAPTVIAVEVVWSEPGAGQRSQTLYG